MSPDSGEMDESSCRYSVPLMDCHGNVRLLKARGVDYTVYTKERRVPPTAAAVFTEMEGSASRAHQAPLLSSSKSETQGQLSGCEGAIRSHFGLLHLTRGTIGQSLLSAFQI